MDRSREIPAGQRAGCVACRLRVHVRSRAAARASLLVGASGIWPSICSDVPSPCRPVTTHASLRHRLDDAAGPPDHVHRARDQAVDHCHPGADRPGADRAAVLGRVLARRRPAMLAPVRPGRRRRRLPSRPPARLRQRPPLLLACTPLRARTTRRRARRTPWLHGPTSTGRRSGRPCNPRAARSWSVTSTGPPATSSTSTPIAPTQTTSAPGSRPRSALTAHTRSPPKSRPEVESCSRPRRFRSPPSDVSSSKRSSTVAASTTAIPGRRSRRAPSTAWPPTSASAGSGPSSRATSLPTRGTPCCCERSLRRLPDRSRLDTPGRGLLY